MRAKQKNITASNINEDKYRRLVLENSKLRLAKSKVDKRLHDLRHKHIDVLEETNGEIRKYEFKV